MPSWAGRRFAFERLVALKTGHAGAAAAAGMRAFPGLVGMVSRKPSPCLRSISISWA
jgi:hypothetical protein